MAITRQSGSGRPPPGGNPPPSGNSQNITLTPEELARVVNEAVQRALAERAPRESQQEARQEEKTEGEKQGGASTREPVVELLEESHVGSKAPTAAEEIQELRARLRELEGGASGSTRNADRGCPFSHTIVREPLPAHFKSAKIRDYDGESDPDEHLSRFENVAMLHCYGDAVKCKVFLTTLVGSAQSWFHSLTPQSISSFGDFQKVFLQHFSSSKRYKKTALSLFEIRQGPEEPLRAFIKKFNKAALEVPSCSPETRATAFTQGLREGDFFRSLTKRAPLDFGELLSRAEKYINMEEAQRQKRETARREKGERPVRPDEKRFRGDPLGNFSRYAPQKGPRDRGVHISEEGHMAQPSSKPSSGAPGNVGYCSYHKGSGHTTEECRELKRLKTAMPPPEVPARRPQTLPWVWRNPGAVPFPREQDAGRRGERESKRRSPDRQERGREEKRRREKSPTLGTINMISGGSTDGDSNRARKGKYRRESFGVGRTVEEEPEISFGPRDLQGVNLSHNDALVVAARVANYEVRRVFVDSGSSVNVIFQEAINQMSLEGYQLEPVETSLFGFTGHTVRPRGEIVLPMTLGEGELRKTVMTLFTVVDAPSSYNVILGRPALNAFRAVASTYHQKVKFPVGSRVAEVRGDQPSSRKCTWNPSGRTAREPGWRRKRKYQWWGRCMLS